MFLIFYKIIIKLSLKKRVFYFQFCHCEEWSDEGISINGKIASLSVDNDKKYYKFFNHAKTLRNSLFTLHHQNKRTLKFWKTDFSQNIRQVLLGVSVQHYCRRICWETWFYSVQLDLKVWGVYQKTSTMRYGSKVRILLFPSGNVTQFG